MFSLSHVGKPTRKRENVLNHNFAHTSMINDEKTTRKRQHSPTINSHLHGIQRESVNLSTHDLAITNKALWVDNNSAKWKL